MGKKLTMQNNHKVTDKNYTNIINSQNIYGELKELVDGINNLGSAITSMLVENKQNALILQKGSNQLTKNVNQGYIVI